MYLSNKREIASFPDYPTWPGNVTKTIILTTLILLLLLQYCRFDLQIN